MMIGNGSSALEVFGNAYTSGSARVIFRHNTTWGNGLSGVGSASEINITPVGNFSCVRQRAD